MSDGTGNLVAPHVGVQVPTKTVASVAREPENYPDASCLSIWKNIEAEKRGTFVGKFCIGSFNYEPHKVSRGILSYFTYENSLILVKNKRYSKGRSGIFIKACKPTKKSTGMFVRLIDCIFYNDNYKVFMELSSRGPTSAGMVLGYQIEGKDLFIYVYVKQASIYEYVADGFIEHMAKENNTQQFYSKVVYTLMKLCDPKHVESLDVSGFDYFSDSYSRAGENYDDFFDSIRQAQNDLNVPFYKLSLNRLVSKLRPYQKDAARFLMFRENSDKLEDFPFLSHVQIEGLYYFPFLGIFAENNILPPVPKGAILADEMGLGKTIEILALIFSNTRENRQMDVDVKVESEEDSDVESAVEMLVSTVVAWEDGQQGLTQIKKFRQTTGYVKTENGYLNYASANSKFSIKCKDCGESFLKAKVRWSADYTKEGHKFYCPECIIKRDKIEVGTTLIMLPESLCHQWYEEIKRHVREDVKIDIYLGVATEGYKNPIYLSKFDIILCPFEIMIKEFSYSTNMNNANIRKNYGGMRLISPLLSINWWRLVLDESQMVDKNHKRVLKVCNQLSSEHRICVTGTPLVDSIHDIYSSAALLGIYPINYPHTFNLLLWNTFTNGKKSFLINFLKQIFWRNTKASVAAQLELSTIKENVIEMHFTPLEESLYRQELKSAREKMNTLITSLGVNYLTKLSSLPNKTLLNMMSVLHNLRLSLTTGGSHHRQANKTVDEFACFTPEVLFERLFQSARNSLEESLRATIMNLNCMSGLTAIINKPKSLPIYQAASQLIEEMAEFNKVLQVHKENSTTFKPVTVDTTQSYHVYKNMADIMTDVDATKYANEIVGCRLKEKDQVKYMIRKAIPPAMDKIDQWNKILSNFELFDKDFSYTYQWFAIGMDYFLDQGDIGEEILVATYLRGYQTVFDRIQRQPLTMSNVYFQVVNHLKEQNAKIKLLREDFDFLREGLLNTDTFFESPWFTETMECNHNQFLLNSTTKEQKALDELVEAEAGPLPKSRRDRTQNEVPKKRYLFSCPMCEMRKKVEEVEYFITTKNDKGERCDPGKVSHLSTICNEIFSRLPSRVTSKVIQSKKSLTKWIRTSRQFCEVLEKVLDSAQDFVSAIRELKQAGTRFSYGMTANIPDVNFRGTTTSVVLTPEVMWTLRPTIIMMKQNVEDSSSVVKRDKTRMQYISSLRSNDGNEKRDCPVCYSRIKYEWFVFPCAHIICTSCFKSYEKLIGQMLKCVTCRLGCKKSSVFLVNQRTSEDRESPSAIPGKQLPLKFNRLLLTIQDILKEKQQNKILIFTSMNSALQPLSDLFKMANLQYALMTAKNTSQALLDFRNGSFPILVIPLSLGANGLNLTQANHVIFLEPITTTSIVSQAIARVHRMGQYRPVTIHHLIISGTIEEEIFNIAKGGLDEDGWTIETLVNLLHN